MQSTGFYTLRIDSVLITEVPAAGWTLGGGSFYICDVDDWRGFNGNGLWLSATIGVCQYNAMLLVPNVPVHFEAPNANTLDFSAVGLTQHSVRGADVVFVSGPAPACIGNFFSSETFMCTATSCYRCVILFNSYIALVSRRDGRPCNSRCSPDSLRPSTDMTPGSRPSKTRSPRPR